MPCTPWRSTSSATRNASTIEVVLSSTVSRRAFGIMISVSTSSASSSTPSVGLLAAARALEGERLGDDAHGERADLAGDARHDRRRAGAGAAAGAGGDEHHVGALEQALQLGRTPPCAAVRPSSGFEPGAEPARGSRRRCARGWRRRDCSSDWMSVLTAMNSTPSTWASIMRLTALTPAPPTPTTRRTGSVEPRVSGGPGAIGSGSGARSHGRALHDVLGDVRGEDAAQALLGRGHALVAADALRLLAALALAATLGALLGAAGCLRGARAEGVLRWSRLLRLGAALGRGSGT